VKWSWRIGRIAGIDLRIHATFVLLLVWVAVRDYQQERTADAALGGVLFILALFASVILHELGHALTARRFGIPTRDITLLPIGGVAQLQRMPREPKQELLIALAGPGVTVALVVILYALLRLTGQPVSPVEAAGREVPFLTQLMWTNVILAVFNLLPAFPMDGGRVLRAALAMRTEYANATRIAAGVGKAFALLFGLAGLFWFDNPFLVFVALFVWLGAASESTTAQFRTALSDVPVARVMIRDIRTLSPDDRLSVAAHHVLAGFQQDFPVIDNGRVVGVLTRAALLKAIAERGQGAPVADVMDRAFQTADPYEPLDLAFDRLRECRCHTLPVVSGGELVGVLTTENVGEYLMIESAMRAEGGRRKEE
jgi:Zn-dependent protease/predicted transcriptional regulator